MAYKISELKKILRYHLIKDPGVFEICAGRVFTAHGKDTEDAARTAPLLIIHFQGGSEFESAPVARRTFHLYAYSNVSDDQADQLYERASEVLRLNGLCAPPDENGDPCFEQRGYFKPGSGPINNYAKDLNAWFVRGTWLGWTFG